MSKVIIITVATEHEMHTEAAFVWADKSRAITFAKKYQKQHPRDIVVAEVWEGPDVKMYLQKPGTEPVYVDTVSWEDS